MKITLEMFQVVCAASEATPRLLDLVRDMGRKSKPPAEQFMSCYCTVNSSAGYPDSSSREAARLGRLSFGMLLLTNFCDPVWMKKNKLKQ